VLDMALIDAGPLIALFDKTDNYHSHVMSFLAANKYRFVSTIAVITETMHMLDFNVNVQLDFLEWVSRGGITLHEITGDDFPEIIRLTRKYADVPMDFADATLMVTAEKLGIRKIISIDSDFDIYRLPGKTRIENILPLL